MKYVYLIAEADDYLRDFCKWLSPIFDIFERKQHDIFGLPGRQDGTWEWLQSTQEFNLWLSRTNRILWCPGQRMYILYSMSFVMSCHSNGSQLALERLFYRK